MEQKIERDHAEYDYIEVTVKNKYETLYRESYPKFGWEAEGSSESELEMNAVTIRFRRRRTIPEKIVLTRLQRQFETAAKEIERLERNTPFPAIPAVIIAGILGAGFIIGGVISFLSGLLTLAIVFAALGLAVWSLSYPACIFLRRRQTKINTPEVSAQYGEIAGFISQAESLTR